MFFCRVRNRNLNQLADRFARQRAGNSYLSKEQKRELAGRMGVRSVTGSVRGTDNPLSSSGGPWSMRYNGAASRRTRAYTNRGSATGMGAAVQNRSAALRERYGNDPRIARAAANIMARATVYK